jgi:hypothetical protein
MTKRALKEPCYCDHDGPSMSIMTPEDAEEVARYLRGEKEDDTQA